MFSAFMMKLFLFFYILLCVMDINAENEKHHHLTLSVCSDTNNEYLWGTDKEEMYYADYVNKEIVIVLPSFIDSIGPSKTFYQTAERYMEVCRNNLRVVRKEFKDQTPPDAPQISIYTRDEVTLGTQNTLICHVINFFPPTIRVTWTRNGVNVTDKSKSSQYYPNDDNTFNRFSHLPFTPQEGDIYTCTVEHVAQERPDTKIWEVDIEVPSMGPSLFCGVGLAVGLLGVAAGTFFLVKGNQCD